MPPAMMASVASTREGLFFAIADFTASSPRLFLSSSRTLSVMWTEKSMPAPIAIEATIMVATLRGMLNSTSAPGSHTKMRSMGMKVIPANLKDLNTSRRQRNTSRKERNMKRNCWLMSKVLIATVTVPSPAKEFQRRHYALDSRFCQRCLQPSTL